MNHFFVVSFSRIRQNEDLCNAGAAEIRLFLGASAMQLYDGSSKHVRNPRNPPPQFHDRYHRLKAGYQEANNRRGVPFQEELWRQLLPWYQQAKNYL